MKITHNKVGQNLNITDNKKAEKTDKQGGDVKADAVSLFAPTEGASASKVAVSSRAQEAKKIKELALAAPDVDQAKVEKFRKLIEDGKYKVDAKAVADKMVDDELNFI
ncbi:MAG: flagellar biosynthesis anti-sigma factor FlgM [Bdellovibrio sp. 28-41-41]|nr:MAG: flagellar biosynthesis anti-sigma factor FlgM [Bdellovibrio sp. 28-41-41]